MNYFSKDDDFWLALERFNALSGNFGWKTIEARKSHADMFGSPIDRGETYFKKELGWHPDSDLKLSRISMEKVLICAIESSSRARALGAKLVADVDREFQEKISQL